MKGHGEFVHVNNSVNARLAMVTGLTVSLSIKSWQSSLLLRSSFLSKVLSIEPLPAVLLLILVNHHPHNNTHHHPQQGKQHQEELLDP